MQSWLQHLQQNYSTFKQYNIIDSTTPHDYMEIDWSQLQQLPEDGSVFDQLHYSEIHEAPGNRHEEEGPPEETLVAERIEQEVQARLFTRGFVPNLQTGRTELEELQAAANLSWISQFLLLSSHFHMLMVHSPMSILDSSWQSLHFPLYFQMVKQILMRSTISKFLSRSGLVIFYA